MGSALIRIFERPFYLFGHKKNSTSLVRLFGESLGA